eukprot:gene3590-2761_t
MPRDSDEDSESSDRPRARDGGAGERQPVVERRTVIPEKDSESFAEMKWRRGTICHWNDVKSVGAIRNDKSQTQHFTFRKAFVTQNRKYAKPEEGDKVWWVSAPDLRNKHKNKWMAIRAVRDEDLADMPDLNQSILNGEIDRFVLGLNEPNVEPDSDISSLKRKRSVDSQQVFQKSDKKPPMDHTDMARRLLTMERSLHDEKQKRQQEKALRLEAEKSADKNEQNYDTLCDDYDELVNKHNNEYNKRKSAEATCKRLEGANTELSQELKDEKRTTKSLRKEVEKLKEAVFDLQKKLEKKIPMFMIGHAKKKKKKKKKKKAKTLRKVAAQLTDAMQRELDAVD